MAFKSIGISDELHRYVLAHGVLPDPLVERLLAETRATLPDFASFSVAPEQVPFLTLTARALQVRTAVEVGTFTGLSAIAIARGLAPGGRLICCDISAEFTSIARRFWHEAGLEDRIELRLGPAAQTLLAMPDHRHIDLAFIDADKVGYPAYWELIVPRMRSGGVILVDNVLRGGRVVTGVESDDDRAVLEFNDAVAADPRVESSILPFADGITMAVVR